MSCVPALRTFLLRTIGAVALLWTSAVQAGPTLDDWRHGDTPTDDDAEVDTAPQGVGADAPWLVPGGVGPQRRDRWLSTALQRQGPLRWRLALAWQDQQVPDRPWGLDGSLMAWTLGTSESYVSFERRHWGPRRLGSLILDGTAPALPAVGWRRSTRTSEDSLLAWLGPWSADVFVGRLQGHAEPARPLLIGMRWQFAPVPTLTLGLSRTLQWGGRGRNESLKSLANALIGRDNVGTDGLRREDEPGNQLAGVDWRWRLNLAPDAASLYGQVVGEDEAGMAPAATWCCSEPTWPDPAASAPHGYSSKPWTRSPATSAATMRRAPPTGTTPSLRATHTAAGCWGIRPAATCAH
jgi:hypothetical protein